jgi:uncharacterized protein YgiB involved in biofilm formation
MRKAAIAAASIALVGCDEEVLVVSTVEECVAKSTLSEKECQDAYQQAATESKTTAPQYPDKAACEAEFGVGECQGGGETSPQYYPVMDGFMILADMANSMAGHYNPIFVYRGPEIGLRGHYMTATGVSLGNPGLRSYRVSTSSIGAQPRATTTTSRGGFGSTAMARSSFHGGSSFGG